MSPVFSLMNELAFPNQRQRAPHLSHAAPLWAYGGSLVAGSLSWDPIAESHSLRLPLGSGCLAHSFVEVVTDGAPRGPGVLGS